MTKVDEHGRRVFQIEAGTELARFVTGSSFVDGIQGPLGSGKSVGWCLRIMRHAQEQMPSSVDGLRKTRWAVVRNTFPDLKRTTIRTWLDTFPEDIYGRFTHGMSPQHRIAYADVRMDVDFLALDKPEDIRKLRSGEYTGIVFNELPFIQSKELFDEATSRVGRYPKKDEGGPSWRGVLFDANAPDEDHWLGQMTGQVPLPPDISEEERQGLTWPPEWGFYMQPAALLETLDQHGRVTGYEVNPRAENLKNLDDGYYERQIKGKSKAWIDSRLMNRIALVVDGTPVWPMFRVETHVASSQLVPVMGYEVLVGLDFGRQPAAVFMQQVNNRALIQYELIGRDESAVTFAPKVKRFLAEKYPNFPVRFYGDPKGADRGQADERTAYDIFRSYGMPVIPPPGLKQNMIETRVSAVAHLLNEMYDGRPRFVLSPFCRTLKVAMAGRYHNTKDERGELVPEKDRYSNVCDALQYDVLGAGEGRRMIGQVPLGLLKPARVYHRRRDMRRVSA